MNHKKLLEKAFVFLIILAATSCGTPEAVKPDLSEAKGSTTPLISYISNLVRVEMSKKGITGLSIAVIEDQQTVYAGGYGFADKNKKIPVTEQTIFNIGSVSKLFTATAIAQLAEKGAINLDKPISNYLPGFSIRSAFTNAPYPTVRNLLTHHSGLPSDRLKGFMYGSALPENYEAEFNDFPSTFSNEYLAYPPNTVFSYCNQGYHLLGNIVSTASGLSFEQYCQQNLFIPMGMRSSSFLLTNAFENRYAKGYTDNKESTIPAIRDLPAGSLNASLEDMVRFVKMLHGSGSIDNNRIIQPKTLESMLKIQNEGILLDGNFKIGFGYWLMKFPELQNDLLVGHGGDLPPYHALLIDIPERKMGIVIMVNSLKGSSFDLADFVFPILKGLIETRTAQIYETNTNRPVARDFTEGELSAYPGFYTGPTGLIEIKKNGTGLQVKMNQIDIDLVAYTDNTLGLNFKLFGFIPLKMGALDKIRMAPIEAVTPINFSLRLIGLDFGVFSPVHPVDIPKIWMDRVGNYALVNSDSNSLTQIYGLDISMDKKNKFFTAKLTVSGLGSPLPVYPEGDSRLIIAGYGRSMGETIQYIGEGTNGYLYYSGFTFRKK